MMSEMKDNFRGLKKSPLAPPDVEVKAPDPEYICDVSTMLKQVTVEQFRFKSEKVYSGDQSEEPKLRLIGVTITSNFGLFKLGIPSLIVPTCVG